MQKLTRPLRTLAALGLVGALALTGCGGGGDGQQWSLGETHPKKYPTTQADIWFADRVREQTDGRIDISVRHSAQLGEEREVIEQVQMGAAEMTRVSTAPVAEFVPAFGVFSMPYLFDDEEHLWRFLEGDYAQGMLDDLRESGFVGLAYYEAGARNFYTVDKPVTSPDDLKGLNIRVIEGSVNADMVEAMGGSPVTMDYGEVYSSLETGVLDGAENNEPSYVSSGHYELAKHFTMDAHQRIPEVLMINADLFDSLSEKDQTLLRDAAQESIAEQRKLWDEEVESSLAEMKDAGIKIHEVDTAEFQDSVSGLLDEARKGKYSEVMAAIDEVRES
ncbi:TRAP transporter substrate-binding protein [Streptomonospora wellingtoniae]|uniref:TRAP transporter substrate-binding protein n=1 Tax=Streptomonospora wellingtoniae TaxID=3075544 RepID=A0ABU2KNR1_9ACTN|nr:TRAP transporter substrate-binding protein [Streptomonospora sp. DSM 45055]MDT0300888.1 TRAP transporter substrate-binding protein [Streptomonospora sp. DSM 45055]